MHDHRHLPTRRRFLKTAATVVPYFGWTISHIRQQITERSSKIALIGAGGIAKWDGPGHSKFADFVAIATLIQGTRNGKSS